MKGAKYKKILIPVLSVVLGLLVSWPYPMGIRL